MDNELVEMPVRDYTGPFKAGDQILDEYEVIGLLGTGGHAFVYECIDRYVDTAFAVKVIPSAPGRSKDLLDRAHAEAKLLFRLNHPNVVRVFTARPLGEAMVCIVMEKLDGLSLRQLLGLYKRFTVTEALQIVRQIAEGVRAAHLLDVIHRDIKPENVFVLPPSNRVKVLDFGIAKYLGQGLNTTDKLSVRGTPLYMSPEHLQNAPVTVRSDIYELGTLAFELLTGKNPCLIDLEDPDFGQMAYVQIARATPPLTRLIRDVGPKVENLIQRSTAKDPTNRFATMDEVIAAVDAALLEQQSLYPREASAQRFLSEATTREARRPAARAAQGETNNAACHPGRVSAPDMPGTAPTIMRHGEVTPSERLRKHTRTESHSDQPELPLTSVSSEAVAERLGVKTQAMDGSLSGAVVRRRAPRRVPLVLIATPIVMGMLSSIVICRSDIQRHASHKRGQQFLSFAKAVVLGTRSESAATPATSTNAEPRSVVAPSPANSSTFRDFPPGASDVTPSHLSKRRARAVMTAGRQNGPIEKRDSLPSSQEGLDGFSESERPFAADLNGNFKKMPAKIHLNVQPDLSPGSQEELDSTVEAGRPFAADLSGNLREVPMTRAKASTE
jgi:serine/threonine protein kinase